MRRNSVDRGAITMVPRPRVPGTNRSAPVVALALATGLAGVLQSVIAAQSPPPAQGGAPAAQKASAPPAQGQAPAQNQAAKIPPDQLDSLVAPIALFQDPLLAQVLAASTYPLEIIQLHQWLAKNPNLKDKALADAVAKQPWDPSV